MRQGEKTGAAHKLLWKGEGRERAGDRADALAGAELEVFFFVSLSLPPVSFVVSAQIKI